MKRRMILLWAALLFQVVAASQIPTSCFAFIREGDVFVHCGGREDRITHQANVEYFAVSDERATLGLMTSRIVSREPGSEYVVGVTTLVNLKDASVRKVEGGEGLISTCGGLYWRMNNTRRRSSTQDLITGETITVPFYDWFRCSSDQRTVVGIRGNGLFRGSPPGDKIADAKNVPLNSLSLSPDGSKVADYDLQGRVCVYSAGRTECQSEPDPNPTSDILSVANSGDVLVAVETGATCYRRNGGNSPEPCIGIGLLRAGAKAVEIVVPVGSSPQWLTPLTAELVRKWAGKSGAGGAKPPASR